MKRTGARASTFTTLLRTANESANAMEGGAG